jgi:hypothetical protein
LKLNKLILALKKLPQVMPKLFDIVIQRNFDVIEDLNAEQMTEGKGADGNDLARYRNPEYARFKKFIGSVSSPIADLKVTGKFHRGIRLNKVGVGEYQFTNIDSKAPELTIKYPTALGLNDESKQDFSEDQLVEELREEAIKWLYRQVA